jgi:hypothetical protein
MFGSHALVRGTLAIDVAVVAESPGSVIEQKLTAGFALRRHKKYRARVNLVIAWRDRDRRCCVLPLGQIFSVHEQAKREKSRDYNNRVEGARARADFWWTGEAAHSAKIRPDRLKVLLLHTARSRSNKEGQQSKAHRRQ